MYTQAEGKTSLKRRNLNYFHDLFKKGIFVHLVQLAAGRRCLKVKTPATIKLLILGQSLKQNKYLINCTSETIKYHEHQNM